MPYVVDSVILYVIAIYIVNEYDVIFSVTRMASKPFFYDQVFGELREADRVA